MENSEEAEPVAVADEGTGDGNAAVQPATDETDERSDDATGAGPVPIAPENVRLARELAAGLRELRGSTARIVENYASRMDSRLARLERFASRRGRNGRYLSAPPAKVLTRMLKELRSLQVKQGKGRPKDMVRLRRLVDELERLADRVEPPPDAAG